MVSCLGPTQSDTRCTEFLLWVLWSSSCWSIKSTSWSGWRFKNLLECFFSQYVKLIIVVCTHWFATEYTIPIQTNLWLHSLQHRNANYAPWQQHEMEFSILYCHSIIILLHLRIVAVMKSFFIVLSTYLYFESPVCSRAASSDWG